MLAGQIINCVCVLDTVGVGVHVVQAIVGHATLPFHLQHDQATWPEHCSLASLFSPAKLFCIHSDLISFGMLFGDLSVLC